MARLSGLHARSRRIAIVGYGTAGQTCAALLSHQGDTPDVFEQAPVLGPVGAGFLLQPVGLGVLWRMGLLTQALQLGRRVHRLYGESHDGRGVMDMRYADLDPRLFGLGMQRGALFALLRSAWSDAGSVRCGCRIIAADSARGMLRDEHGGQHGPYDLIIAADGAASSLRTEVRSLRMDRPYPWGALWCLCPAAGWPHPDALTQRYVAARKMIGMLPVGTRPGDDAPRLSFFWSLPTDRFDHWQRDGIDAWKRELETLWPAVLPHLGHLTASAQLTRASYRDSVLSQWRRGRLVLVGDAAHAMSPQLGQGVNMALLDPQVLCDALHGGGSIDDALARYAHERRRHTAIYQFWSRWLTPVFQSHHDVVAALRDRWFLRMGRLPGGRGMMLRVLSGTQRGWLGRMDLAHAFLDALGQSNHEVCTRA